MIKIIAFLTLMLMFQIPCKADEINFSGKIVVEKLNKTANFRILKKDNNNYDLIISIGDKKEECTFNIKKLTAPQQTRGFKGYLWSNKLNKCQFKTGNIKDNKYWSGIELIDFKYYFAPNLKLTGTVNLKSIKDTHLGLLQFD
jgi:hypothetical protein